jgi:multiple sugar transport system permease protein
MYALPSTVIAIPFFFYAQWLGIPWWMSYGAALCAIGVVLAVLLLSGYLRDLKRSAIEGLCVHEPAEFKRHVRVVGWDARAVIGVTALFCFLGGWHDLVFGAVLSSGALRPLNVSILGLITPIGTFWGEIAARSVPSIMVAVICVALAGEGILRGFALGRSGG